MFRILQSANRQDQFQSRNQQEGLKTQQSQYSDNSDKDFERKTRKYSAIAAVMRVTQQREKGNHSSEEFEDIHLDDLASDASQKEHMVWQQSEEGSVTSQAVFRIADIDSHGNIVSGGLDCLSSEQGSGCRNFEVSHPFQIMTPESTPETLSMKWNMEDRNNDYPFLEAC